MLDRRVRRPAMRYFGSKFRMAEWIIGQFPPHECYVEPFGGGMGVLLRKRPSAVEVYNDLDEAVVNFFRVLRERTAELMRAIELTPYARREQRLAFEDDKGLDEVERARRLYVRAWMSYGGGRTQVNKGWRNTKKRDWKEHLVGSWNRIDHFEPIEMRLKNVLIECDEAMRVIERFDGEETLFYIDPPYDFSLEGLSYRRERIYQIETSEEYHRRLAGVLNEIRGMAVVSGKPSGLYDELYGGWRRLQKTAQTDFQSRTTECLWISPGTMRRQGQLWLEIGGDDGR